MPLPAAALAAYTAFLSSLPAAAPVIGVAAVGFVIVAAHDPHRLEEARLAGNPEVAAECLKRNVASLNTRLVATTQPLYGTSVMGVNVNAGVRGDALMVIVLQEAGSGSVAEFRPLAPPDPQPDILAKIIAGC
ncbi:MAG TPA: hypothetical protein VD867_06105 [Burkholderiales bacterium]|nr:hypothetical protein [Burkholderiales bacterium]